MMSHFRYICILFLCILPFSDSQEQKIYGISWTLFQNSWEFAISPYYHQQIFHHLKIPSQNQIYIPWDAPFSREKKKGHS